MQNLLIATMWAAHETLAHTFTLMLRTLKGSPEAVLKLCEEQAQVSAGCKDLALMLIARSYTPSTTH